MSNVYRLSVADGFRGLDFATSEMAIGRFHGEPMAATWAPLPVEVMEGDETLPPSDSPFLGGIAVLSDRAVDALGDLLEGRVELLPVDFAGPERYWVVNVLRLADVLDRERCVFDYFASGRLMSIDRYAFVPEKLVGETIFKLVDQPKVHEYVTDAFVDRVQEAGLTGLLFPKVWNSELGDVVGAGAEPIVEMAPVHIIPIRGDEGSQAMAIAYRAGVHPEEEANLVLLPTVGPDGRRRTAEEIEDELHTPAYARALAEELKGARDYDAVDAALERVRERLQAGTFPR